MLTKLVFLSVLTAMPVLAQWETNGVAVCDTAPNGSIFTFPRIAPDGKGGAYICWRDVRSGDLDVYAQRVDSNGNTLWKRNGIPVVQAVASQDFPRIASDDQGNAFIAWEDSRATNTFPYVQKLNRNGQMLWQVNGIKAAEVPGIFIDMACDARGGVILAWTDVENVFVQRLDSLGNRVWGDSAVQVTNRPGTIYSGDVAILSDGSSGAIVVWSEGQTLRSKTVYCQRVDSAGKVLWLTNGVALSDTLQNYGIGVCIDIATRAAIVSWLHSESQVLAQKIGKKGEHVWNEGGVQVGEPAMGGGQVFRTLGDDQGGAFLGHGRWIQHLDSAGMKLWGGEGAMLITSPSGFTNSTQASDGCGGVFNFMEDFQQGFGTFILVQRIDGDGNPCFGPDGVKITRGITASGRQYWPVAIAASKGSSIVCWNDNRSSTSAVYVTRVDTTSVVTNVSVQRGTRAAPLVLEQNYPNPFNPTTIIEYELPTPGEVQLIIYDSLGRDIRVLVSGQESGGFHRVRWDGRNKDGKQIASGVYFYRLVLNGKVQTTRKTMMVK